MATERICSIEGCENPHLARGWCSLHYQRWRVHGDPIIDGRLRSGSCSVEGCGEKHYGKGWCKRHYMLLRHTIPYETCTVDGCGEQRHSGGLCRRHRQRAACPVDGCRGQVDAGSLCSMHYQRWRNTGSTELAPSPRLRGAASACGICNNPDMEEIEGLIRSGVSISEIARRSEVSRKSVRNHKHKHMDNLEMATAVASAAAMRLTAARRRAQDASPSLTTTP